MPFRLAIAITLSIAAGVLIGLLIPDRPESVPPPHPLPATQPSRSVTARVFTVKPGSVYDADTFRLLDYDGADGRVRLALIDAPELDEPRGIEARDRLRELIDGRDVTIEFSEPDGRRRGAYGRLLLSVEVDGRDVETVLVCEGLAEWRK